MMPRGYTLADLIGYKFEHLIHDTYPFLTWNQRGSNLPDFSSEEYYLEAKGQCEKYGGRIKPHQVSKFRELERPVFYIYGWHSQIGLSKMKRAQAVSTIVQLGFHDFCLIDNLMIENFFDKEQRYSKAQKDNGDNHYCILKPRHIRDIILDAEVKRGQRMVRTHTFYELVADEWDFSKVKGIQLLMRKELVTKVANLLN